MNHRFIHFQVKLEAIDLLPIAKCLIAAEPRRSEMIRAAWDVKSLSVPLKNLFRSTKPGDQRISFRLLRRSHVVPTDFFFFVRVDFGSERFSDQLRAEADP